MPGRLVVARHKKSFLFLSVSVFFILLLLLPRAGGILISDYKTGRLLYFHAADAGDSFSIHYIHSVNKSPVEDYFKIGENQELILYKTVFKSFGAGVPSSLSDGGILKVYDDRIEVSEINRRIDNFLLFIGVTAEHRFRIDKDDFPLRMISDPQKNLLIETGSSSLFDVIALRFFNKTGI